MKMNWMCLLVLSAACGGTSNTVSGTLAGQPFSPVDAFSTSVSIGDVETSVQLTSFAGACAAASQPATVPSSTVLAFDFLTNATLSPATYTVNKVPGVFVLYGSNAPTCRSEDSYAGTVTVTSADQSSVTGTFDVTLGTDHVTGSFSAPICPTAPFTDLLFAFPDGGVDGGC